MNPDKLSSMQPFFGGWYIESKIAEGKNSKFYKAYSTDGIEKNYAGLKIVKFPSSEQELSRVIASEMYNYVDEYLDKLQATVTANMGVMRSLTHHKNIVSVYNFTIVREASCFYLISLVELLTPLNEYLSFESISKNDVITLGKDICRAMEAFREKGIVHHNITPENIYADAKGNYILGDFGVYDYEQAVSEASAYVAPELYNKNYLSDVSSDIYSLGILLYKLLNNNRLPFLPPYPAPVSLSDREQSFARCMRGETFPTPVNADYKLGSILADTSTDVTATAVMYTSKVFQNNVRHYFQHLRTSFKALGDTVLSLLGHPDINVEVAQGPEEYMELQVARQELATLVGVVDPAQKRSIVNAILRTHPDNDILANLYAELNSMPQPTEMEMQMQDTIAKMKEAIDAKDKEIMQLTAQVDAYEKSSADFDKSLQAEFLKARQQHEFRMEENAQKAMLDQGGDAVKSAAEADKAQMDLEQKAVQLEAQKVKSATEIMKAMGV